MNQITTDEIHDLDIYEAFEKIEDRKAFLRAIGVTESNYSRWKSQPVQGEDNHRRGPIEIINAMEMYARAKLDKAREIGDSDTERDASEALEIIGRWGAQKGKGIFLLRDKAKLLVEKVTSANDELKKALGFLFIITLKYFFR